MPTCKKIQPTPDSEATLLSNGEPLEITETVYRRAPVLYKWCHKCGGVTRHVRVKRTLIGDFIDMCDAGVD